MKKIAVCLISVSLLSLWLFRYYTLNDGFAVHGLYPERI